MSEAQDQQRQCPTRADGRVALFTHRVTRGECQGRQRRNFHRCFSCAYNNAYVARHGLPEGDVGAVEAAEAAPARAEKRPKRAAAEGGTRARAAR